MKNRLKGKSATTGLDRSRARAQAAEPSKENRIDMAIPRLARLIHEPSCQGVADPALRCGDGHGTQFLVARGTARFRVFAELRGWA